MRIVFGLVALAGAASLVGTALHARPAPLHRQDADARPDLAASDPALGALSDRIERAVRMPADAAPLTEYRRFYAWADTRHAKVIAVYLRWGIAGRKWIDRSDLPLVFDGGCSVVTLVFDMASGEVERIDCNGQA